jgi:PAS domain S-box-containing protein
MASDDRHQQLLRALEAARVGTFEWDVPAGRLALSPGHERLWGFAPGTFPGTADAFRARIHRSDLATLAEVLERSCAQREPVRTTFRVVWPDGSVHWIETAAELSCDADGTLRSLVGANWEITAQRQRQHEYQRLTQLYDALGRINRVIVWPTTTERLFETVCEALVESGGFRMCWIGMLDDEEPRLVVRASCGDETRYLDGIQVYTDDRPEGRGPTGAAFRTGQPYICNDILTDPATLPWRDVMIEKGIRASAAFPIRQEGQVVGTLTVYAGEIGFFAAREVALLVEAAQDVSFALDGLRREAEHAAAERAAEGERAFSEEMLAGSPGILFLVDPNGRLLRWSKNVERITGFDDRKVAAMEPVDFFVEADRPRVAAAISETFATGSAALEASLRTRDGEGAAYYFTSRVMRFHDRDCLIGIGTDIRALKQAHQRTEEQAALLDRTLDAVIVFDLDDRITLFNAGAERIYGWSAEEAIGTTVPALLYRQAAPFAGVRAIVRRDGTWSGEQHHVTRIGSDVDVEARWTVLRDDHGAPTAILMVNTDVTERRKIEQQLLRLQRMESLSTLAGGIAHDLNNVLAPIMTSLSLLREVALHERDRRLLDTLQSSAERGRDLVRQVLVYARGATGQRVAVQVPRILGDLVQVMRETFPRSIDVQYASAPDLPAVVGDPTQLHQVFLNLVVNARDAMPDGGTLTLEATARVLDDTFASMNLEAQAGPYVVVTVRDTGTGIPAEIRDRIFDPFFTTKAVDVGTGLGLSTAMAIVRRHRGFITVESEEGNGATFTVFLRAAATAAAELPADEAGTAPRGNGELILFVDDEPAICLVARRTLEAHGYRVVVAQHGAEAITLYAKQQKEIALVFTDMAMPVMDGPSLIAALKVMSPHLAIVGSSGLDASEKVTRAAKQGVVHFAPKPYSAETMLRIVHRALAGERPVQRGPFAPPLD